MKHNANAGCWVVLGWPWPLYTLYWLINTRWKLMKIFLTFAGNENNFETMEACVVNCGGPSDHTTASFSSPTTPRALTLCKPDNLMLDVGHFLWLFSFQLPTSVHLWRACVHCRRKLDLAIFSKRATILIESCKSADNLGNYCTKCICS